jgi:hypothetical protein
MEVLLVILFNCIEIHKMFIYSGIVTSLLVSPRAVYNGKKTLPILAASVAFTAFSG